MSVTARLHRERVTTAGVTPARWFLMTHGIYGSGANWRSIARKIVERRPEWGAILVDLRGHGRSELGAPPYTIAACADDLRACLAELAADGARVDVVSGHSFGGKVALALRAAHQRGDAAAKRGRAEDRSDEPSAQRDALAHGPGAAPRAAAGIVQTWVLDSTPSARPGMWTRPDNDVREVWETMRALPRTWPRRDDLVLALTARGHSKVLAQWLAMNVEPDPAGGVTLRLDLDAIRAMLEDYYAIDLWPAVEDPALPGDVHVVIAERSDTVSPADRARLAAEPPERRVHAHTIAGAGHWLHLDAPAAVIELFSTTLPGA